MLPTDNMEMVIFTTREWIITYEAIFFTHRLNCNIKFLSQPEFPLAGWIVTVIAKVWPRANWAVVTYNSTMIIEVVLINVVLIEGFLYIILCVSVFCLCSFLTIIYFDHSFCPWMIIFGRELRLKKRFQHFTCYLSLYLSLCLCVYLFSALYIKFGSCICSCVCSFLTMTKELSKKKKIFIYNFDHVCLCIFIFNYYLV